MLYFLINPRFKSSQGWYIWKKIEKDLNKEKIQYKSLVTKDAYDAQRFAEELTEDSEDKTVIILGGDGTLNSFLNGLKDTRHIKLGYIPVGSGNDFARGMGITKNYKEEMNLILHDKQTRSIHYGIAHFRSGRKKKFFVSSGIGYDAKVCYDVDHSKMKKVLNRLHLGRLIYLYIGIRNIIKAETFEGSLKIDDEVVLAGSDFLFTSFHMLPYEGGGFKFCPNIKPGDDSFHICAVENVPKWKIPFIIPQAFTGHHTHWKGVHQFQCTTAEIRSDSPQYVHLDGETDHLYDGIKIELSKDKILFLN